MFTGKSWQQQVFHDHAEKCVISVLESQLEKEMGYFGSQSFYVAILELRSETEGHKRTHADFSQNDLQKVRLSQL